MFRTPSYVCILLQITYVRLKSLFLYVTLQVNAQNLELRAQLKERKTFENALQEQVKNAQGQVKSAQEQTNKVEEKYEKLKALSNGEEMEVQLHSLQKKIAIVKDKFECIDVIKKSIKEVNKLHYIIKLAIRNIMFSQLISHLRTYVHI